MLCTRRGGRGCCAGAGCARWAWRVTSHVVPTRLGCRKSEVRAWTVERSAAGAERCARDNDYCDGAACAIDVCRRRSFHLDTDCSLSVHAVPQAHGPAPRTMTIEPPLSDNFSRLTDDLYQLPQPAPPPQNSPLPTNRPRNGLQTDYWRTCCHWTCWAAVNGRLMTGTDAPPSGRARPFRCHGCVLKITAFFQSFSPLRESSGRCARSLGELG